MFDNSSTVGYGCDVLEQLCKMLHSWAENINSALSAGVGSGCFDH